jgi:protein-tyrosine phosphatase
MAEQVFRQKAQEAKLSVTSESAGVSREEEGNPPDTRARKISSARGYEIPDRHAQRIEADDYFDYDLIFGMTDDHVRTMKSRAPEGTGRKIHLFMDLVAGKEGEDVPDPWYGSLMDYEYALDLIEEGVDSLVTKINRGDVI